MSKTLVAVLRSRRNNKGADRFARHYNKYSEVVVRKPVVLNPCRRSRRETISLLLASTMIVVDVEANQSDNRRFILHVFVIDIYDISITPIALGCDPATEIVSQRVDAVVTVCPLNPRRNGHNSSLM